jgi:tetratricopeptide (TPR) repeat protein
MNSRQGIRLALQAARLFRPPSAAALSTTTRRWGGSGYGTTGVPRVRPRPPTKPIKSPKTPKKRPNLDLSLPRFQGHFNFPLCPLAAFEEAAERRKKSFEKYDIAQLHRLYQSFHEAIKQANVTENVNWEDDFFAETKANPSHLHAASILAFDVKRGRMTNPERLLYMHMLDTAAEKGHVRAAIMLSQHLIEMGDWESARAIYPRAAGRIRSMARREKLPDLEGVVAIINAREGRDAEALEGLQSARRIAAESPDAKFTTEATCALELGKLLAKKGDREAALAVLEDALKYDTREVFYEAALLVGEGDEARYRRLMTKAAVSGYMGAIKAMVVLEMGAYDKAMAAGDEEAGKRYLMEALEWENLIKGWQAKPEDAKRYF